MIGDLPGIVIERFTTPENSVHKINFCEIMCLVERFKLNCSCLIISPSELLFGVWKCEIT